ncbi:hypothetical protein ANCCAN_27224 [Ancylostoma caninum]|uniref:Myotubularin phosphatase domain-containing protein n=1 Tax=Ancylostoma caninum TaxID=29170 RepID=A0A368F4P4_ANCCA|nr:hypothetical protein ANCCAN_27224 [Ancylostoma caninum]
MYFDDLHIEKRTKSLWTYLDHRQDDYLNPFYEPTTFGVLSGIETRAAAFKVWHALYNRFDDGLLPRETATDMVMTAMEHVVCLSIIIKGTKPDIKHSLELICAEVTYYMCTER